MKYYFERFIILMEKYSVKISLGLYIKALTSFEFRVIYFLSIYVLPFFLDLRKYFSFSLSEVSSLCVHNFIIIFVYIGGLCHNLFCCPYYIPLACKALSCCWLSRHKLWLEISNYPNSSWCWVDTNPILGENFSSTEDLTSATSCSMSSK